MAWQIGLDVGNDSVKTAYLTDSGTKVQKLSVSNTVTSGVTRNVLQAEADPLRALDITIDSPALGGIRQHFFVGALAAAQRGRVMEARIGSHKAREQQTFAVGLGAMAYAVARSTSGDVEVPVNISTVLPVTDWVEDRMSYQSNWKGRHKVKMDTVPGHEGRTIILRVEHVQCFVEGMPALLEEERLGGDWRKDIRTSTVSVVDLGALTADCPTFTDFRFDNTMSEGHSIGLALFLDDIAKDVRKAHDFQQISRADIVQTLFREGGKRTIRGVPIDIRPIAEPHINAYVQQVARLLQERWDRFPEIDHVLLVGGASEVVRDRLGEYLPERYAVHFTRRGEGVWSNALGSLRTLQSLRD